jgi:hypothetical protein
MAVDDDDDSSYTSSSERGLSLTLKRQLLFDIHEEGGIADFKLDDLLLKKPDVYGSLLDTSSAAKLKRQQLRNLVGYWKRANNQGTFSSICSRLTSRTSVLNSSPVAEVSSPVPNRSPAPRSPAPQSLPTARTSRIVPTATMGDYVGKSPSIFVNDSLAHCLTSPAQHPQPAFRLPIRKSRNPSACRTSMCFASLITRTQTTSCTMDTSL